MVSADALKKFASLFRGYSKAYGTYEVGREAPAPGEKNVGKAITVYGRITEAVLREHLDGLGKGLGVIMLQDNDTCRFGSIDIDIYTGLNYQFIEDKIKKLRLPLIPCRTKSGGLHLYAFFSEDIPATVVRDRISEWTAALQLSGKKIENFPKQVNRANQGDKDPTNWINVPYYDAENTVRYAITNGAAMPFEAFLDASLAIRVPLAYMLLPYFKQHGSDDLFAEGPPCLVALHGQGGFPEGTGNDGVMAIGTYLKKRFGDQWESYMDKYNSEIGHRGAVELAALIKNISKKDYAYGCKKEPLCSVCQKRVCLTRLYGVGDRSSEQVQASLLSVIRYDYPPPDPPLWSFELNSKRVLVDNDTFYTKDALNKACMSQSGVIPIHMSTAKWLRALNDLIQEADIMPMPEDAGPTGQLWENVEMFLQQGVNAMSKEEVLTGKVYREGGKAHFRGLDLFKYLDTRRVRYGKEQFVWQLLHKRGATKVQWKFGKKATCNVWVMPFDNELGDLNQQEPAFGGIAEF